MLQTENKTSEGSKRSYLQEITRDALHSTGLLAAVLGCWTSPRHHPVPPAHLRRGQVEVDLYFCFLGSSWSMLAVCESRSELSQLAAPAPKQLRPAGTHRGEGARISAADSPPASLPSPSSRSLPRAFTCTAETF